MKAVHTQSLAIENTPEGRRYIEKWKKEWGKRGYLCLEKDENEDRIYVKIWKLYKTVKDNEKDV